MHLRKPAGCRVDGLMGLPEPIAISVSANMCRKRTRVCERERQIEREKERERETEQSKVVRQIRNPTIQGHLPSNWILDGRYYRMAHGRPGVCLKRSLCVAVFGLGAAGAHVLTWQPNWSPTSYILLRGYDHALGLLGPSCCTVAYMMGVGAP